MKTAQTWSMDVLMAVALFVLGVMILFYFLGIRADTNSAEVATLESERLPRLLSSGQENLTIIVQNKVDVARLVNFSNLSYRQAKAALGIRNDFCIYFEDASGNVVNISDSLIGIGSSRAKIGGQTCGER